MSESREKKIVKIPSTIAPAGNGNNPDKQLCELREWIMASIKFPLILKCCPLWDVLIIIQMLTFFKEFSSTNIPIFRQKTPPVLMQIRRRSSNYSAVFFWSRSFFARSRAPKATIKIEINCEVDREPTEPRIRSPLKNSMINRPTP